MGLWLWDADPQFSFGLADELTTIRAALIRAGALDDCGDLPPACEVVDLRAVRLARMAADAGPDA